MSNQTTTITVPEPSYALIDTKREGKPEVLVVNQALLSFAQIEIFPWHLCLWIEAQDLVENGMPSSTDSELLFRIGDEIESTVLSGTNSHGSQNALFLARSTWDGSRELLFQVHDPEVAHQALQALLASRTWDREWDYQMESDPEWSNAAYIFQLFPQAGGRNA